MKAKIKVRKIVTLLLAVLLILQLLPAQVLSQGEPVTHTVHFKNHDGTTTIKTVQNVPDGTRLDEIAPPDSDLAREGYTFVQWTPPETYITGDENSTFTFIAQYRSTYLYELNIKYQYENGSPAALSYMATYAYGEEYEVESPTIQGFYIDPPADEIISGTAGITRDGATALNYTVTYKASTGTSYTVEHYLQNINDNDYTLASSLTDDLTATTGSKVTVSAKNITGFTAVTPTQEVTIAPDGSTVVKMYYDRISYILTYNTAGGSFIPPFQARYGAAITAPANPIRTGFTFAGWSSPIPQTLTKSQTITASWTALSNINYTLVYWLENADPIPGTTTYEYSYHSAATRTGAAGTVYTLSPADRPAITYFTYSHYDTGVTIAGDGSTVINIYYTRNSYTATFNLNKNKATLTIGGITYTHPQQQYSFTAKYESNISHLWPTSDHIPPRGTSQFYTWSGAYTNWTSKQTVFIADLLNQTFTAEWSSFVYPYDLHYMFESLDGTGDYYDGRYYQQDSELSHRVYSTLGVNWSAKHIPGLTNVDTRRVYHSGEMRYDIYFYYERNTYTLDFQSHGQLLPGTAKSLKYGASILPSYNFIPAKPSDLPEHSFGGWYTTASCTPGTEFDWVGATMPDHNLRLFAKWVPPLYIVRFDYTHPDGTAVLHNSQQVYQGQKAVQPADPAYIPGYTFDGWYYSGTLTKYIFDAQVFNNLYLTGRYLPKNDRTYTVRYLHTNNTQAADPKTVTGQTTGTIVTEQAVEVPGYLPDAQSKTLTLQADNNVITFYYSAPYVDYTVRYIDHNTGMALLDPVTKNSGGSAIVTETAPSITNKLYQLPDNSWVIVDFTPDLPQKSLYLTSNPDLNIITFYYEYIVKNHYEVRYLEEGTDVILAEPKHAISGKSEVVELPKEITNYRTCSVHSTYQDLVRSSSANYISTALGVSDPVNQDPHIITFYYAPERIEIEGNKTWVDQGAPDQRPVSVSLTLYANNVTLSSQPSYTWDKTSEANAWIYKYINLPAAVGGVPQYYTVRETVPAKYVVTYSDKATPGGTNINNTLDGGTTGFSGTKTWVDSIDTSSGYNPRPDNLALTFFRKGYSDAKYVKMNPQPEYIWDKETAADVWTYTVTGLKEYEDGYPVEYKAEETLPIGYKESLETLDDPYNFKNEVIYTTATKTWVDGPTERPTIWLRVYRQVGENGTPEQAPYASWKELKSGTTEVQWRGLEQTDENGNPYIFSVREVDVYGNPFTPPNYNKVEDGLNVTNTYVIPTDGKVVGTKTWENGSATHPDLWLQLWRKTTTGGSLVDEAVPLPNNENVIKVNETGDTSYEWEGLETTDINGNVYTFYVKEGQWDGTNFTQGVPAGYSPDGEGTLNLTNAYVIPTDGEVSASKIWINGPNTKPDIWFRLYRKTANGTWAPVPGPVGSIPGLIKPVPEFDSFNPDEELTVIWEGLETTDINGAPYEFAVVEGVYNDGGDFIQSAPLNYEATGQMSLEITNTYVPPKRADIIVKKQFANTCLVSVAPVTPVTLELQRRVGAADPETVGSVILDGDIDSVEFLPWQAKFTNLDATDQDGNEYIYEVVETIVPGNYERSYNQENFTVTNTWQAVCFTAKKKWAGGYTEMLRPPVTFQLQRKTSTMDDPENVGAPVVLDGIIDDDIQEGESGEHEKWIYTWHGLPEKDSNNNPYTYSVKEAGLIGYLPPVQAMESDVYTITNTYAHVDIKARKVIDFLEEDIPGTLPQFELVLRRSDGVEYTAILDGEADVLEAYESGELAPDPEDPENPNLLVWNYIWKYLPKYAADGTTEFTYTLSEPNPPTGYVRESITYDDVDEVFVVKNLYRQDVFRAFKYWDTKIGTVPVTFRLEQAKEDGLNNWIYMAGKDIELNGIPDEDEEYPNGTLYYEESPWNAVWTDLDTQVDNVTVRYRVQEVLPITSDGNYEDDYDAVTTASTVITNTSLKTDITAAKLWVDGKEVRPDEITLILKRYKSDGETEDTGYIPSEAPIYKPLDNSDNWGEYTWHNQERFYIEDNVRKEYVYKVFVDPESFAALDPDEHGSFTSVCEDVGGVHTITSTYEQPFINLKAAKVWDGGDASNRPAVTIRLWRKYASQGESEWVFANPAAPGHTLDGEEEQENHPLTRAREYAPWKMEGLAPLRDKQGNLFNYKITETATVPGFKDPVYIPDQTVEGEFIHFVVTNEYIIPTGEVTVKKVFELGKNVTKPDVWFQLWRKTTTGGPLVDEVVPDLNPINITNEENYTYTFSDIATTDFNANPYTFYVKEGNYNEVTKVFSPATVFDNFSYSSEEGTTLTNRYESPRTARAVATKTWVNGPDANQTNIDLTLYRRTTFGTDEVVLEEDWETLEKTGTAPTFTYTWTGLKNTDSDGNPYTYYVREPDVVNGKVSVNEYSYLVTYVDDADNNTTAITNTYDPPTDATFTATKTWSGGPNNNKTAVTLDLYRKSDNVQNELVTGVTPQITGQAPKFTYEWTNLVSRDSKGDEYTFTVKERGEDNESYVTINGSVYEVTYGEDSKYVTNTYQIPKDKEVKATKEWLDGSSTARPAIWFKLQRRIFGGAWQDVPGATQGTYAEIKQVPAGLSVTWEGQERTDFNGNVWEYAVVEGKLEGDVFTEGTPENYKLSGTGTLDLINTYTIPTAAAIAQKQWVDGPPQKPTVWFKLQRAVSGGQPEDIPAGENGSAIMKLLPGVASVQWDNVKQTDIDGNPYTFSIVEGLLNEDTQEFTPGLPESYEYTASAMSEGLGVVNTYTSPTESKTVTKSWAGGGPTPYPEIWLRLERTTSPTIPWEAVPNATPIKVVMPEGSTVSNPITWENVALKNENAVPYVFRVTEGRYDANGNFEAWTPPNYKVEVAGDGPNPLDLTNVWQTVELSTEIVWDGAPAAAYDLPDRKVRISVYRYVGHTGEKEFRGSTILDGNPGPDALDPLGYEFAPWQAAISDRRMYEDDGQPITYIVEQEIIYLEDQYFISPREQYIKDYRAFYTTDWVQNDHHWVFTNTFNKTTVEVFKEYVGTEVRPPVTIVLFQHSVEIENGVEVDKAVEFDRFELDGIPCGTPDSGEPYEKQRGLLIWPNLPIKTLSGADVTYYSVTEIIPEDTPFPYQRVITGNATDGFHITNTKNEGTFTAVKRWDVGQAPLPENVTFKLWRWVICSGHNYDHSYKEKMPDEYDGVMDGTVDTVSGAHGKEGRPWEYTWTNLPLNGDHDDDPTEPVYYRYFVEEVPLGDDYVIDAVTSSSMLIKNVALKTQFTARKTWVGGPTPAIRLQLIRSGGTGPTTPIGAPVLLDGVADAVAIGTSGELSPWTYTWTDLPRFEDNDTSKQPYVYTAKEVDAAGHDFIPEDYDRYGNDSDSIINVHRSTVSAVKIWAGGDAQRASDIGPATYLTLYRRLLLEEPEAAALVPTEDLGGQAVTKPVDLRGPDETPDRVAVTWTNMPWGNDEGMPYVYSVVETDSAGNQNNLWKDDESNPQKYIYNTTYNEDNPLEVTSTYRSPTREVTVNKFWHGVAQDETLPDVWLRLWRGLTADEQVPLTMTEGEIKPIPGIQYTGGSNQLTWDAMDKFDKQGREYVYTVREYAVADASEPGTPEGFTDTRKGLDLHNIKLVSVTGQKVWVDVPEGKTPPAISLQLLQNGTVFKTHGPVPGDAAGFSHTWSVPQYYVDPDTGVASESTYSVAEAVVPNGYTMTQVGNTITNTYDGVTNNADPDNPVAEPVTINITKVWLDEDGNPETDNTKLPESLPIKLTGTDGSVRTHNLVPDTEGAWKHTYTDLYKYDVDGEEIIYSLTETIPLDYTLQDTAGDHTTGFTLTNKHTPGKIAVQVKIDWDDADNQDGKRPESVEIQIFADGTQIDSAIVTKTDSWSHTFTDLPQYEGGEEISYTITYDSVASYTMAVAGYNVTYAYVPGKVSVPVTKVWDDNNNEDGVRPQSVSIRLLAGGADTGKILTLSEENGWTGKFTDLDEYAAGQSVVYAIEEVSVADGYKTAVTGNATKGYIVTNSRELEDPEISDPEISAPEINAPEINDPEISDDEIVAVVFDPAGGTWSDASTGNKEIKDRVGAEITIMGAPTREGCEFQYWQGSQYQPGDKYIISAGGHTFVAVWKEIPATDPPGPTDHPDQLPSVGDNGTIYLWFSLPILLATALLFILRKKEQTKQRN